MSRLSRGEREFISGFGDLSPPADAPSVGGASDAGADGTGMRQIDARGVSPPLPLLRAHRALRSLQPGQDLKVVTSYAQSLQEFQALTKYVTAYELVSQDIAGEEFVHVLRRRR